MTISILGCGWYGLPLAKALVADGITVNGSTTSIEKLETLKAAEIAPFLIDLNSSAPLHNTAFFQCDILIIAIPPKSRSGEGDAYLLKLNNVIAAISQSSVKKVILISSTGVYADRNTVVDENTEPQPNTPAGQILLKAEELFRQQDNIKTAIIRFGGLVGPGRDPGRFFAGKKDIPNGLAPVNLIHLQDCIGITRAIIDQNLFGHTISASAPHHPTRQDFYTQAAAKAGLELPEFIPELNEWKLVSSALTGNLLKYNYAVADWFDWLKQ